MTIQVNRHDHPNLDWKYNEYFVDSTTFFQAWEATVIQFTGGVDVNIVRMRKHGKVGEGLSIVPKTDITTYFHPISCFKIGT